MSSLAKRSCCCARISKQALKGLATSKNHRDLILDSPGYSGNRKIFVGRIR
jgi:hypothetical protein